MNKDQIVQELISEIANAINPSDDQMIVIRLIRSLLPDYLDRLDEKPLVNHLGIPFTGTCAYCANGYTKNDEMRNLCGVCSHRIR